MVRWYTCRTRLRRCREDEKDVLLSARKKLGGDPAGAKVMASIAEGMRPEDYSGLFVLNSRRPFTATVEAAKRMMDEIVSISHKRLLLAIYQ